MPESQKLSSSQKSPTPTLVRILIPLVLILVWLAIGSAGGKSFGEINDVASNDRADQLPSSAESTQVAALQHEFRESNAIPAILVLQRDAGLTDADHDSVDELSREVNGMDAVEQISQPIISEDEQAVEVIALIPPGNEVGDVVIYLRDLAGT